MSNGNMTVNVGYVLTISDNSCAAARIAVESFYSGTWKLNSCTSVPVKKDTQLNLSHQLSGSLTKWTVTAITATESIDEPNTNDQSLGTINIEVMFLIAFIFLFFIGFHTGSQNGNR